MTDVGMRGVVAGSTAICTVADGHDLYYRGYDIKDLVTKTSFVEVAYLLLRGELPTNDELTEYKRHLLNLGELPDSVVEALKLTTTAHPMDAMRCAVVQLGVADPEPAQTIEQTRLSCEKLLVRCLIALGCWHSLRSGGPVINQLPREADSLGEALLWMISDSKPSPQQSQAMDQSLILYAEHEYNASTFAARVIAATEADSYSAITGAVGALKGPLHGGANEKAMELIENYPDAEQALSGVKQKLANKEKLMGFGHAVYKSGDPRHYLAKQIAQQLAVGHSEEELLKIFAVVENHMVETKKIHPNLDFYAAACYRFLGIPTELFTPIFVCSRISGWGAHIIEQRQIGTLIRPNATYTGPSPRQVKPIHERH